MYNLKHILYLVFSWFIHQSIFVSLNLFFYIFIYYRFNATFYFAANINNQIIKLINIIYNNQSSTMNSQLDTLYQQKFNFGKHKGKTYQQILKNHYSYVDWIADQQNFSNKTVLNHMRSLRSLRPPTFEELSNFIVNFGKYKNDNKTFLQISKTDIAHLQWIARQPNWNPPLFQKRVIQFLQKKKFADNNRNNQTQKPNGPSLDEESTQSSNPIIRQQQLRQNPIIRQEPINKKQEFTIKKVEPTIKKQESTQNTIVNEQIKKESSQKTQEKNLRETQKKCSSISIQNKDVKIEELQKRVNILTQQNSKLLYNEGILSIQLKQHKKQIERMMMTKESNLDLKQKNQLIKLIFNLREERSEIKEELETALKKIEWFEKNMDAKINPEII